MAIKSTKIGSKIIEIDGRKIEVYLLKIEYETYFAIKPYAIFTDNLKNSIPKIEVVKEKKKVTSLNIGGKEFSPEVIKRLKMELAKIPDDEIY